METKNLTLNYKEVERLYPGHELLSVAEAYIPGKGWTSKDSLGEKFPKHSLMPDEIIKDCIKQGAVKLQLRLSHNDQIVEPDYLVSELIEK